MCIRDRYQRRVHGIILMQKSKGNPTEEEEGDTENNGEEKVTALESKINKLDTFISLLEEHCQKCVEEEKFSEADLSRKRIKELKEEQAKVKVELTKQQHEILEMNEEAMYQESIEKANAEWDEKTQKLEEHFIELENELIEKQKEEMIKFNESIEQKFPATPKQSVALLNLKQVQLNLVKQKKFDLANETKEKVMAMEAEEAEKWAQQREAKITTQVDQLDQKHKKEKEAHEKRVQTAFEELDIERNKEINRITQNHINLQKQMSNAQKKELAKMNKSKVINQGKSSHVSTTLQGSVAHQGGPPSIPSAQELSLIHI
eukprot:TRINITY_DN2441_c0_g1_i2.p1 TRINITY_DN2441_c0_g1~~TRINITY_DN2441_c0_g1_i2.p1  ORF type:complete len:318 (-),score=135.18 TRINITY_DN2441_c0_g1_i2:3-956(-)